MASLANANNTALTTHLTITFSFMMTTARYTCHLLLKTQA